jgi:hypothetical protein
MSNAFIIQRDLLPSHAFSAEPYLVPPDQNTKKFVTPPPPTILNRVLYVMFLSGTMYSRAAKKVSLSNMINISQPYTFTLSYIRITEWAKHCCLVRADESA